MRRRWAFLCARPFLSGASEPGAPGLGGTEQAIIGLAEALVARGHAVEVAGAAKGAFERHGVTWSPGPPAAADIAVAINDARLLPASGLPIVWLHNEVEFGRELRRFRLGALLRHRPAAVFVGSVQAGAPSRALPFRGRAVIPHGLPERILTAEPAAGPPPPRAIFTSQAYRGLAELIEMWRRDVAPLVPGAVLTAHIAASDLDRYRALACGSGVAIAGRIAHDAVVDALRAARVMVVPGHVSETFCMAAAEAVAMGVPVVTLGIGALRERVRDGVDGFVCRDVAEMARRTRALLTDDALWGRMHMAGVAARAGRSWDAAAAQWEALIHTSPASS